MIIPNILPSLIQILVNISLKLMTILLLQVQAFGITTQIVLSQSR